MSQQDAAVAMFESLRVAFEDVEEFLDDGCLLGNYIVVPDNDSAVHHVSTDGDAFAFRRSGFPLIRGHGSILLWAKAFGL